MRNSALSGFPNKGWFGTNHLCIPLQMFLNFQHSLIWIIISIHSELLPQGCGDADHWCNQKKAVLQNTQQQWQWVWFILPGSNQSNLLLKINLGHFRGIPTHFSTTMPNHILHVTTGLHAVQTCHTAKVNRINLYNWICRFKELNT